MKTVFRRALLAALAFSIAGCLTEPKPLLDDLVWESVDNQNDITEGVTVAAFFSDISFLGQAKTPTLCYSVSSRLSVDGNTLTLNVDIISSKSGTCTQQAGGVRYTGVVKNLSSGTYTVHVIQNVSGVGTTEFSQTVKL